MNILIRKYSDRLLNLKTAKDLNWDKWSEDTMKEVDEHIRELAEIVSDLRKLFGHGTTYNMIPADTSAYVLLRILFSDAQHYGITYGISIAKGLGKSFAAKQWAKENKEKVVMVQCTSEMSNDDLIISIARQLGVECIQHIDGITEDAKASLVALEKGLLLIDDCHLLSDVALCCFINFCNRIKGEVGIILMGNDYLRNRIIDGLRLDIPGYEEIYKAIGRRFITLNSPGPKDAELICGANHVPFSYKELYNTNDGFHTLATSIRTLKNQE